MFFVTFKNALCHLLLSKIFCHQLPTPNVLGCMCVHVQNWHYCGSLRCDQLMTDTNQIFVHCNFDLSAYLLHRNFTLFINIHKKCIDAFNCVDETSIGHVRRFTAFREMAPRGKGVSFVSGPKKWHNRRIVQGISPIKFSILGPLRCILMPSWPWKIR